MADTEVINAKVNTNIGEVTKDAQGLASEFRVMGVSLNDVKKGLQTVAMTAKKSFATVRAGIMSTGIGALVIAIVSLATWFTKTKKGAEVLERAFAGIGATVNVIVDRVSKFGGAIVKLFQGDRKGALEDIKGTFKGIGEEIVNDTKRAIELKKAFQELRDNQRDLNVETAKQRSEIERLKLIAEDLTKDEEVRLKAAQDAFDIENKLLEQRVANAEEALRIQRQEMELGENLAEDLDKEAELEINLFNIKQESITKQIELNNKINAIKREAEAKEIAALEELKRLDQERMGNLILMPKLAGEAAQEMFKADMDFLNMYLAGNNLRKKSDEEVAKAKISGYSAMLSAISGFASESKELAVANAVMSTYEGANAVFTDKTLPTVAKFPMAAAVIINGLANVKRILSTDVPGGGGGGTAPADTGTPAPEMLSGRFTLGGGEEAQPVQAYVVTDDMTNNQNKLANIRRRATI
jgi:hypothetical protein